MKCVKIKQQREEVRGMEELLFKFEEILDRKLEEKLEQKIEEVLERKLDEILERKLDEILERKLDKMLEQKLDQILDKKLDDKFEQKFDEKFAEIKRELFLFEQNYGTKIDAILDAVSLELDKNLEKSEKIRQIDSRMDRSEVAIFGLEKRVSTLKLRKSY